MIIWIEDKALGLMIFYLVLTFLVSAYLLVYEICFNLRRKINYKNYTFFVGMYNTKVDVFRLAAIIFIFVFGLVLFGLFVSSYVINLYLVALIPIYSVMGFFLYLELTRKKYNNPYVRRFDTYYRDIDRTSKSQLKILTKVKNLKDTFIETENVLYLDFLAVNNIVPNDNKKLEFERFNKETISEFDEAIESLNDYNSTIIAQFNETLSDFLYHRVEKDYFEIPDFETIDTYKFEADIKELNSFYDDYFKTYIKQSVINGEVNSSESIISLLDIAEKYRTKYDNIEVLKILQSVDKNIENKHSVAKYLLEHKILSNDILFEEIIDQDWEWCISSSYITKLPKKDIIKFYQTVVEKNAKRCCNKLLKIQTINQVSIIDKVLALVEFEDNSCIQLLKFTKLIKSNTQEFSDEGTRYENMAIALKFSLKPDVDDAITINTINQICQNETYYENKDEIARIYVQESEKLQNSFPYITDVLLCLFDGELAQSQYMNSNAVMNLYLEDILTLNSTNLRVLNILLSSVIMLYDTNKKHIVSAINSIQNDKIVDTLELSYLTAKKDGKTILKKLLKTEKNKVVAIINRVEKERQSLDMLEKVK